MPSSSGADSPPWSGGTPGWVRNVCSPCASRTSRLATPNSDELPPCPLKNTSLRAGVVATQRPMSSSTRSSVSALSQIVPADHACSFDFV